MTGVSNTSYHSQASILTLPKGKIGKDSAAAKYAAATPSDSFSIQDDKPYAEVGHMDAPGTASHPDSILALVMDGHTSFSTIQGSYHRSFSARLGRRQSGPDGNRHYGEIQQEATLSIQSPLHQQGPLNPGSSQQEAGRTTSRQRSQELP